MAPFPWSLTWWEGQGSALELLDKATNSVQEVSSQKPPAPDTTTLGIRISAYKLRKTQWVYRKQSTFIFVVLSLSLGRRNKWIRSFANRIVHYDEAQSVSSWLDQWSAKLQMQVAAQKYLEVCGPELESPFPRCAPCTIQKQWSAWPTKSCFSWLYSCKALIWCMSSDSQKWMVPVKTASGTADDS